MKLDIKTHLKARKMTQEALAAEVGISAGFLSEIMSGKKMPTVEKIDRIAEVLNVSVADLIVSGGRTHSATGMQEAEATQWIAPPRSRISRALAALSAGLTRPETYRAALGDPSLSVRAGDVLLIDMDARPSPGALVVATVANEETGAGRTILRQWVPGWLVGGDAPLALAEGGNSTAILGVVSALLRAD